VKIELLLQHGCDSRLGTSSNAAQIDLFTLLEWGEALARRVDLRWNSLLLWLQGIAALSVLHQSNIDVS